VAVSIKNKKSVLSGFLFPGEQEAFRTRVQMSTYEWAKKNMKLAVGPMRGRAWSGAKSPYAKAIMDLFDRPETRKLFLVAPSQTTKTTIAYSCLGAVLSRRPGPAGIGMPDEKAVERIFREKLIPHFSMSPALRRLLKNPKDSLQKREIRLRDGSSVHGLWSGSESVMSSVSLRYLFIDEEDAY